MQSLLRMLIGFLTEDVRIQRYTRERINPMRNLEKGTAHDRKDLDSTRLRG